MYDKVTEWAQKTAQAKRRADRVARYEARYALAPDDGLCVYCDAPARVLDHVPPLVVSWAYPPHQIFWKYRACYSCNEALGTFPDQCLSARRLHVLQIGMERMEVAQSNGWADRVQLQAVYLDQVQQGVENHENLRHRCMCEACWPWSTSQKHEAKAVQNRKKRGVA